MALADSKKVATMVNIVGQQAIIIRAAVAKIEAVRTKFQTINPDVTGTPLEGTVALVNGKIDDLVSAASGAVIDGIIAAIVPSHRNGGLD